MPEWLSFYRLCVPGVGISIVSRQDQTHNRTDHYPLYRLVDFISLRCGNDNQTSPSLSPFLSSFLPFLLLSLFSIFCHSLVILISMTNKKQTLNVMVYWVLLLETEGLRERWKIRRRIDVDFLSVPILAARTCLRGALKRPSQYESSQLLL